MGTTGLEVRLREGRERAEVARFTKTLDEIVRSLREIDRVYLMRGTRATWVLADLSHQENELVVRLEARPSPRQRTTEDMLVPATAFVSGAAHLSEVAEVPDLFLPTTVQRLAELAHPQRGVREISVATYNGKVGRLVPLTEAVETHAREAVRPHQMSFGSVSGVLDLVGVRHRGNEMRLSIYDAINHKAIDGYASAALAEQLRVLWRHRVIAGGKVKRNQRGQILRIDVDRIEPLPDDSTRRPRPDRLLGVAPDWLGKRTVDEYLREVRGA